MKNLINNIGKNAILLCLLMLSFTGFAQEAGTNFTVSLANVTSTSNTMEFDILLTINGTGDASDGQRLSGMQVGINYNTGILNAGTVSCAYLSGKSTAIAGLVNNAPNTATSGHIRITASPLLIGAAIDVVNGTYTFGRYRLTNTASWTASSNAQLWLQPAQTGRTLVQILSWPYGATAGVSFAYTSTLPAASPGITLAFTSAAPLTALLNVPAETCFTSGAAGSIVNNTCFGQTNGSALITMSPAPSSNAITYTVDGGASTPGTLVANAFTVSGLATGPHSVVVTGNGGCTTPVTVNFTVGGPASALTLSLAHTNTLCATGATGTITATANGGTAPYTYSLDGGASQGSPLFTGVAAGLHSVTVTDANSCVTTSTVTVGSPAALTASATATATTTPSSNDGTATAAPNGGTAPYLISWNTTPVQNGATATGLSAGTYTATIVDDNGCTTTAQASVTAPACSIAVSATHVNVSCFGGTNGSISAGATGATGTVTYTITPGGSSNTTGSFTDLASGTYSIAAVDQSSCSTSTSVTVGTPTAVVASSTAGTIACFGGTTTVVVSATGGNSPYTGTGTFTVSAGSYSFTVTDDNGCTSTTTGTVTQPAAALLASSTAGTIACNGGTTTVTVSATGGTAPYTGTGSFTVSAGAYSYTVTDANGCTSTTSGSVSQPSAVVASSTTGTIACNGGTTTVTVSATGGTAPYTGTGSFTVSAGAYSYTVTDANGCTSTTSGSVSQPAQLVASSTAGTIACNGGTTTVTVSATGGTAPYTGTGSFTVSAGAYSYTVSDANGCSSTTSGSVSQPAPLTNTTFQTTCNSYTWSVTGVTYNTSGTYTGTSTNGSGCTVNETLVLTIVSGIQWVLDADNDGYYTGTPVSSCASPGAGYTTSVIPGGDCNDAVASINPGAIEICWNNIDDNCDGTKSELCAPVVVNMTAATVITNFSLALSAVPYTYTGATSLGYRFWIKNMTSGQEREVISTSRFVTIPSDIRSYTTQYQLRASAIINSELVPYAGNTITVTSPGIPTVMLAGCGSGIPLVSIGSTIASMPAPNVVLYTFRARLTSDNGASPTYYFVSSGSRFINSNSFSGLSMRYNTSYSISVSYTFNNNDGVGVQTAPYGSDCTITTPGIPVVGLSSPACGSTLASFGSTISAAPALYATKYRFRVRRTNDLPVETATYGTVTTTGSRFTTFSAASTGLTLLNNTSYTVSVQYSIMEGTNEVWSNYGPTCVYITPAAASRQSEIDNVEIKDAFSAVAYPNPFANNFMINVTTSTKETINIKVYDMVGRLIEQRDTTANDLENLAIGDRYPSGVYNVNITQGEEMKTLRVIKR